MEQLTSKRTKPNWQEIAGGAAYLLVVLLALCWLVPVGVRGINGALGVGPPLGFLLIGFWLGWQIRSQRVRGA